MSTGAVCYRCGQPARFQLLWLGYQRGVFAADPVCAAHARGCAPWAMVVSSTEERRW